MYDLVTIQHNEHITIIIIVGAPLKLQFVPMDIFDW